MKLRFKEGQKVLIRCNPGIFREGTVNKYIEKVNIYETYDVTYKNEDGKEYSGQFYDVDMMLLSL